MSKKVWFAFLALIIIATLAILCARFPWFSEALYNLGVNYIGAGIVNGVTGLATGLMTWGSTGLAPAVAVLAGDAIIFTILWTILLHKVWDKRPAVLKKAIVPTYQNQPTPQQPTPIVTTPSPSPQKVEEEKPVENP